MQIVVPIRTVTQPPSADEETLQLNRWDCGALETGCAIARQHAEGALTAVAIGPPAIEKRLTAVAPAEVESVVRVWDEAVADLSPVDIAQRRQLLATVVGAQQPELVCIGVRRSDYRFEAMAPALAVQLNYTWATVVTDVSLRDRTAVVYREIEDGQELRVELPLPAVVSVYTAPTTTVNGETPAVSVTRLTTGDLGVSLPEPAVRVTETVQQEAPDAYRGKSSDDSVAHIASVLEDMGVWTGE